MTDDDAGDTEYLEKLLALTSELRRRKGRKWTQAKMAVHLGTTLDKYKKYETRSPMPHRLIVKFCDTVGVDSDDYLTLNVDLSARRQARASEAPPEEKPSKKRKSQVVRIG